MVAGLTFRRIGQMDFQFRTQHPLGRRLLQLPGQRLEIQRPPGASLGDQFIQELVREPILVLPCHTCPLLRRSGYGSTHKNPYRVRTKRPLPLRYHRHRRRSRLPAAKEVLKSRVHNHVRILRTLGDRPLRIFFAMQRDKNLYDPERTLRKAAAAAPLFPLAKR